MSVSVSAAQLRILVVAIAVATAGQLVLVSIGDHGAVGRAAIAEPPTGELAAANGQSKQLPTRLLAGGSSRASSCAPRQSPGTRPEVGGTCKGPPHVAPSALTLEDQEMLRPRSVNTLPASWSSRPS